MSAVLRIAQGDADTLTETVTTLSSLAGYTAKMYIYNSAGTLQLTETGEISGLVITYTITNEDTKDLTAGTYWFETKVFDAADHVYTPQLNGKLVIRAARQTDPS